MLHSALEQYGELVIRAGTYKLRSVVDLKVS